MRFFLKFLFLLAILFVFILLGAQNDQLVTVNYLIAQSTLRLSLLMGIMLISGIVISGIGFFFVWFKLNLKIKKLTANKPASQKAAPVSPDSTSV